MKATSIAIALTATLGSAATTDDTPKYYVARNMIGQNGICYNENACKTACQQLGLPTPLGGRLVRTAKLSKFEIFAAHIFLPTAGPPKAALLRMDKPTIQKDR